MQINTIARVTHEANRALRIELEEDPGPTWDEAPDWMVESVHQGIHAVLQGQDSEELHESWVQHKRDTGWVYGEVKDDDAKTHPQMVPYHELPEGQKAKDHLFQAIVKALTP